VATAVTEPANWVEAAFLGRLPMANDDHVHPKGPFCGWLDEEICVAFVSRMESRSAMEFQAGAPEPPCAHADHDRPFRRECIRKSTYVYGIR
jgi:hypothetical protein